MGQKASDYGSNPLYPLLRNVSNPDPLRLLKKVILPAKATLFLWKHQEAVEKNALTIKHFFEIFKLQPYC